MRLVDPVYDCDAGSTGQVCDCHDKLGLLLVEAEAALQEVKTAIVNVAIDARQTSIHLEYLLKAASELEAALHG
jgi:hypothetical protein